jgi:hypothetical protein
MNELSAREILDMENIYINKNHIDKIGFKTFRSLIKALKKINESCRENGYAIKITIVFPMKW